MAESLAFSIDFLLKVRLCGSRPFIAIDGLLPSMIRSSTNLNAHRGVSLGGSIVDWNEEFLVGQSCDPTLSLPAVPLRCRSTSPTQRHSTWIVCAIIVLLVGGEVGCRAFRGTPSNKPLVSARQLSLRGADALQRDRYSDAELLFSQALAQSPLDERAHWGYATTLWNRGDKEQAIYHMSEALRLSGKNPEYAIRLGEMYLESGKNEQAKQIALDVLSVNRNHAQAWALLGDTHRSSSETHDALECYHRALLIRSDYPRVQLSIAELYRTTQRPERSLSTLDHMVDLHPEVSDQPEHMLQRGLTFADLNRPQEATMLLAKASERLPPELWQRQIQVAETQYRLGELVQARITLGRVLAEHSLDPEVLRVKGSLDESFAKLAATSPILPNAGGSSRPSMNSSDASLPSTPGGRSYGVPGMNPSASMSFPSGKAAPRNVPPSSFMSGGAISGNPSSMGPGSYTDEAADKSIRAIPGNSVSTPKDQQFRR